MTLNKAGDGSRADETRPWRGELPLAAAARRLAEEKAVAAQAVTRANAPAPPATPDPAPPQPTHTHASVPPRAVVERAPAPPVYAHYPPPAGPAVTPPIAQLITYPDFSPWWKRVCAALLDGVVVSIPSGIIFALLGRDLVQTNPVTGVASLHFTGAYASAWALTTVLALAYYAILEGGPGGASVGKLALNIIVRDVSTGGPIGYGRALVRRLIATGLWWLLVVPGLLDVLWPLWDDRRQTLHDKFTKSVVMDKP